MRAILYDGWGAPYEEFELLEEGKINVYTLKPDGERRKLSKTIKNSKVVTSKDLMNYIRKQKESRPAYIDVR